MAYDVEDGGRAGRNTVELIRVKQLDPFEQPSRILVFDLYPIPEKHVEDDEEEEVENSEE